MTAGRRAILLAVMTSTVAFGYGATAAARVDATPAQQGAATSRPPARDTSARPQDQLQAPTARITGRVLASDNGRPVKRARVSINAAELGGGRGTLTDDAGSFDFTELPAGRYTITASKSGFVSLSYGQRRPLQAGTPLQLADGQQLRNVDFQLPRGSAIAGRVLDEDGEPMPGVSVRVMRYQYLQGDRRLVGAGGGQTDDKGQYRVWGLMPGDYYVNATARPALPGGPMAFNGRGGGGRGGPAAFGRGGSTAGADSETMNYAPTYYPGTASVNDAKAITVGLSQELLDINFGMQLVRTSRVSGRVTNPDGSPVTNGQINMTLDVGRGGNQIGATLGGRIMWDGSFSISNVAPGRYLLRARGNDSAAPQFAVVPVTVNGADVNDLSLALAVGARLAGTVVFPSAATDPPDASQFRITAPSTDAASFGPQSNARLDKDFKFVLDGVPAGSHFIRSAGNARGWTLKSVSIGGRDVTDVPIELRSGDTVGNITITFTDKVNEINGTIVDDQGRPASEYTVLAFSTDASLWRPQSRQIATARPDQTGQYRIRTLPSGEYYVVTVDPAEQGEWFEPAYLEEHRAGAFRVTLAEGDVKTQDFKIRQ
ncbi:MAG TPA: carboxypeptidase regulatory-like domain-containing protein [Vicinamibacterales bacterium]|jgi:protocatechuate 3,4-dioxygenase beta subunit